MKKKLYWLLLLVVPVVFIAASMPVPTPNTDGNETGSCASYGIDHQNYNGDQGCPYEFDFSDQISAGCNLTDVDLDRSTPEIDHTRQNWNSNWWYVGNAHIQMTPAEGFGGPGFTVSFDVRIYFVDENGNIFTEDVTWTGIVDDYPGPYPSPCY